MSTAIQMRQADAEADAAARAEYQREQELKAAAVCAVEGCDAESKVNRDGVRYCSEHAPILLTADETPVSAGWRVIGERLRQEMPVKQRPGRGTQKFDYITARQVADRLDNVVGPGNWETRFLVIDDQKAVVQCTLTIFGQNKCDVGYPNSPGADHETEPYKAAFSDAFKRAAVQWGIGRWIYDDL